MEMLLNPAAISCIFESVIIFTVEKAGCVFVQPRLGQGEEWLIWRGWPVTQHLTYYPWNRIKGEPNVKWYKWRILKRTYPHTERDFGDEWFIIKKPQNPPAILWMACKNSKMIIFMKIIVTGGTRSACQPQDFHALFFPWVCLFLL